MATTPRARVRPRGWTRLRAPAFDAVVVAAGLAVLAGLVAIAARPQGRSVLQVSALGGAPLWVVLLVSVPLTAWSARHSLALSRFGGAVNVALDAAVPAFLLWLGLGALLAEQCDRDSCPASEGATAAVGSWVLLAWLLGVLVAELTQRDNRPLVRAFNVGLGAIAGAGLLAVSVAVRLETSPEAQRGLVEGVVGPRDILAVVLAATAYVMIDLVLSAISVAWSEGARVREVVIDVNAQVALATAVAVPCGAVLAALVVLHNAWAVLLLVPVLAALLNAARAGADAAGAHERGTTLYEAAATCQRAESASEVLSTLVEAARGALHTSVVVSARPLSGGRCVPVTERGSSAWLVAQPRRSGRELTDQDTEVLTTLASLGARALERIERTAAITQSAETDSLTGVATREVLMRGIAESVATEAVLAEPGSMSLVFCDVDDFKAVNDTFGHGAGDQVLTEVAHRLRTVVRPHDIVARLGGDEFALLLPGADAQAAHEVRARLAEVLERPYRLRGVDRLVAVSVGQATWPPGGSEPVPRDVAQWLLEQSDLDMYAMKATRPHHQARLGAPTDPGPGPNLAFSR